MESFSLLALSTLPVLLLLIIIRENLNLKFNFEKILYYFIWGFLISLPILTIEVQIINFLKLNFKENIILHKSFYFFFC